MGYLPRKRQQRLEHEDAERKRIQAEEARAKRQKELDELEERRRQLRGYCDCEEFAPNMLMPMLCRDCQKFTRDYADRHYEGQSVGVTEKAGATVVEKRKIGGSWRTVVEERKTRAQTYA